MFNEKVRCSNTICTVTSKLFSKELVIEDKLQFEIQNVNEQELELLINRASNFTIPEIEQY